MDPDRPSTPTTILVVDDDASIRGLLRQKFEQEGFAVAEAADGAGVEAALDARAVDIITLDIGLQRESGLDIARHLRARGSVPIIMITGAGDEIDRVVGLELGADDYITKPFSLREVVARVRTVLRRTHVLATTEGVTPRIRYVFPGGVLDPASRTFLAPEGCLIDLTTTEFNLLELFLRNPHRVLTRDCIMNALKGHDCAHFDRSVDAAITRLRKKCEPNPAKPIFIKTVRGVGYLFAADVQRTSV